MKISSYNEWDTLKSIVVGSAKGANWPSGDPVFARESEKTTWKETPVPSGPVPQWIIDESEEDLQALSDILTNLGVEVIRPKERDFVKTHGMYNYCPRDRLLIAGDTIVDCTMMYPCRNQEIECLTEVTNGNTVLTMPRNQGMVLDAANICRLNDKWLFLNSWSGNARAALWIKEQFRHIDIEFCSFYAGVHIDSTIVPVREGLVMINGSRIKKEQIPEVFDGWQILWIEDVVEQSFYEYPYASKWVGMNVLVVDPHTVIVDAAQKSIINMLERRNFTVIPHTLRHARTLGGGLHCVTLDLHRENA